MPEVPKVLHFVIDKEDETAAVAQRIKRWAERNASWKVYAWCNPATMGQNHAVSSAQAPNVEVRPLDLNAVPGAAPAAGSDAVRYGILLKHGGCYIDSDVEPGDPMPTLNVNDSSALFAPSARGRTGDAAVACTIGSHRIQTHMASAFNQNMDKMHESAIVPQTEKFPENCLKV